LEVVGRFNIGMHCLTFVGPLVENGFHDSFVAGVEKDLPVESDDVGYCRSEITRAYNTDGFIR
jgi:hypothetical protein